MPDAVRIHQPDGPAAVSGPAACPAAMLCTLDDVWAKITVSPATGFRMKSRGDIGPAEIKIGRSVKYLIDEVDRWIASGLPNRKVWREMERQRVAKKAR